LKTATDEQHSFFLVELKNNAERGFVKVYLDRSACSTAWLCCSLCIFLTEHFCTETRPSDCGCFCRSVGQKTNLTGQTFRQSRLLFQPWERLR